MLPLFVFLLAVSFGFVSLNFSALGAVRGVPESKSLREVTVSLKQDVAVLTKLGRTGIDFTSKIREFHWNVSERPDFALTFGSEQLDSDNCQVPGRKRVILGVSGFGFGSNILMYANYIVWSAFSSVPYTVLYVLSDESESGKPSYSYQKLFEETFAFVSPTTSCSKQSVLKGQQVSVDPSWDGRWTYWEEKNKWLEPFYRSKNNELSHGLRALVVREVLRLKDTETRNELERRVEQAKKEFPKSAFTVAIHIRRTDKLQEEAKFVHSRTFVQALKLALQRKQNTGVVVVVLTDDPVVVDEFSEEFYKEEVEQATLLFRVATVRSERGNEQRSRDAFWEVLVDLRLMIDSDVFIGSQSSNLGIIACLLRFQDSCYSVENDSFEWSCQKDKSQ